MLFLSFQGIPGHLLPPILENLDPLEIGKLEDSSIFKAMSMLEKSSVLIELYTFKALCGMFLNTINFPAQTSIMSLYSDASIFLTFFLSISFQKIIERN